MWQLQQLICSILSNLRGSLSRQGVSDLQAEAILEVEAIWNCRKSLAKTLLMHYMWDKEKLLSEYSSVFS